MLNKNSLNKAFIESFNDYAVQHNYIYLKKYDIYMKCTGTVLIKYFFVEKLSGLSKNEIGFSVSGNVKSIYSESLEKNEMTVTSIRNKQFIDIIKGYDNTYPHTYYCNNQNVKTVMEKAFSDAKSGILSGIESVNSMGDYLDYCHRINTAQIRLATDFCGDSLAMIVADDHYDMTNTFNEFMTSLECKYGISYINSVSKAYYTGLVEKVSLDRDKVFKNKDLYKKALDEAEKRKNTNLTVLRKLGLIT